MGEVNAEKQWVTLTSFMKACLQSLTVHWKFIIVLIFINPVVGFIHNDSNYNSYALPLCKDRHANVDCLLWVMIQPTMPVTFTESNCQVLFHTGVCQLRVTVTWALTVCKFAVFHGSCYQLLVFFWGSSLCSFEYSDILEQHAVSTLPSVRTCNHHVVKQPKRRPIENAVCWTLVMCSSVDYFEHHEASVCWMWQEQLQNWRYWSCWMWCCILEEQFLMFRRGILPSLSEDRWTRTDCKNWLQVYRWEWRQYSPPRRWEPLTQ